MRANLIHVQAMLCYNIIIIRKYGSTQVNEKFHKVERVYRDCIKKIRDKTRVYSISS